jgi:thiol-disulfide isomerase/thioredoxin
MLKYILITFIILILILIIYFYQDTFTNNNDNNCGCNNNGFLDSDVKQERPKINKNLPTIYNFNTSWCHYSIEFQKIWDEFTLLNKNNKINIIDVKCDNPKYKDFCQKYNIYGYPTIIGEKNNKIKIFNKDRTIKDLNQFVKEL